MNASAITGFGSRLFGIYSSVTTRVRYWRRYVLAAIAVLVLLFVYAPDWYSSQTYHNVRILDASQNSSNYVIKFEVVNPDNKIPQVLEVRNMRQTSDFHFVPAWLQEKAAGLAEYNKSHVTDPELVTVRVSGLNLGDAHKSSNITQINPWLWSPLYNLIGSLLVFAYFGVLLVGIPSLLIEGVRPGNAHSKRKAALLGVVVLVILYVIEWMVF